MISDEAVRIKDLPNWWRDLFRPRENDRIASTRWFVEGVRNRLHMDALASSIAKIEKTKSRNLKWKKKVEKKLEKLRKYQAKRNRSVARPLNFLLKKKFKKISGPNLMDLPVKAIEGVGIVLSKKLKEIKIDSVSDLAKASLRQLQATRMPKEKLLRINSYAKDILKHATTPGIEECTLPLEELLVERFKNILIEKVPDLGIEAIAGIGESAAKKIRSIGVGTRIRDICNIGYNDLIDVDLNPSEASKIMDYVFIIEYICKLVNRRPLVSTGTLVHAPSYLGFPTSLGTLRVLEFEGTLELGQTVTQEDPSTHGRVQYDLEKPNEYRESADVETEPYVGFIIVADKIVITESIQTNGNDLVLVARTIQVGESSAITINTKPAGKDAAKIEENGLDADNGGDLVFLCKQFSSIQGCTFITSGGTGQDGGEGRSPEKKPFLTEGVEITAPVDYGFFDIPLTFRGESQCKFEINPDILWSDTLGRYFPISFETYSEHLWAPRVDINGEWALKGTVWPFRQKVHKTHVDIPEQYYPTAGRPGGYGGNPGKISLIMSNPDNATGVSGLQIQATTGDNGNPGKGGEGRDHTPDKIMRDGESINILDYIRMYAYDQRRHMERPGPPSDPFDAIVSERLDSGQVIDKLEDSILYISLASDIHVAYAPSLELKNRGILSESKLFSEIGPSPSYIGVSAVTSRSITSFPIYNSQPLPVIGSLGLNLHDGPNGKPKQVLTSVTESLKSLDKNWYEAVYELLPRYPLRVYKQADEAYRQGDFNKSADLYGEVVSFAQEVPDFQRDHSSIISDADYRLVMISNGIDYFGFTPDVIISSSPTYDYIPLDLTGAYSDSVDFYNNSIRDKRDSIATIELGKATIQQFLIKHSLAVTKILNSLAIIEINMGVIESEIDAIQQEINALHWANQRLGGLLQCWVQRVNDKIEELKKQQEDQGSGWWTPIVMIWDAITMVASIFTMIYSIGEALVSAVEAIEKISNLEGHMNELQIASEELQSNLDFWTENQINSRLDEMSGMLEEIGECGGEFDKLWTEAEDKLNEAKSAYDEVRGSLDRLGSVNMTEQEAIDFQNNILLADEIGVTGAMDYLQIQEQIKLNNDMLVAKYHSLEAQNKRQIKMVSEYSALVREFAVHKFESKYLRELLDLYTWNIEDKKAAVDHLKKVGQCSLDALMCLLQKQTYQLKFLNLNTEPTVGYYAYSIDNENQVGAVLQRKAEVIQNVTDWIAENSNTNRLKVLITNDENDSSNPGGITKLDLSGLERLSMGEYIRPSKILEIEPLRETRIITVIAEAIENHLSNVTEMVRSLNSHFLIEENGSYRLLNVEALGFDVSHHMVRTILSRERNYHPILNTSSAGQLDDVTVVLAYALAKGKVTSQVLSDVLQQNEIVIPRPLRERIEVIESIWDALSSDINGESVKSLRSVIGSIQRVKGNASEIRVVLDDALTSNGRFVSLDRFHLEHFDIQSEITNGYDPDFEETVLANIYNNEPMNVIVAVILLHAELNSSELELVAQEYTMSPNVVGSCISNALQPEWESLRRSILEKRHYIMVDIQLEDFMNIPNASEFYRYMRALAARAKIEPDISFVLEKLPSDIYAREKDIGTKELIEINFENVDEVVNRDPIISPSALNIEDYHYSDIFGRSILGNWALSFTYKGNRPAIPKINRVELEFLYTYVEQ